MSLEPICLGDLLKNVVRTAVVGTSVSTDQLVVVFFPDYIQLYKESRDTAWGGLGRETDLEATKDFSPNHLITLAW